MALMVRCPLTGEACNKPATVSEKTFFIAEPKEPEDDKNRRGQAVRLSLPDEYKVRSALEERQPYAFTCKICEMIQGSEYGMADISTGNPNVILELGMMIALGKPTVILCRRGNQEELKLPSDLAAIEVIPFNEYIDIVGPLREIVAKLPSPATPLTAIELTEQAVREVRPQLAADIRKALDDHRRELVSEFHDAIKQAKLATAAAKGEKVQVSAPLEKRLDKLEASLQKFERLGFVTDAKTALYRGNFHYDRQEYEAALGQYDWSLTLRPDFPEALNNRGNTYDELKQYEEALADFNRALELRPDHPDTLNNRGTTYHNLELYDEALADYNRVLELRPDYANVFYNRGTTYIRMQRYEESLADLNRGLELQPDSPKTVYNLACLFSVWRKPDDAISYLEKAIGMAEKYRQDAATDADFDNIRDDPRFRRLVEGV